MAQNNNKSNSVWTRPGLALFLLMASFYLLTSSGRLKVMDEYMVFFQTQSLATSGTLAIPQAKRVNAWFGKEGKDGQPYAPYGPAQPLAFVPSYWVGSLIVKLPWFPERNHDLVLALCVVSFQAFLAAGVVLLFYLVLLQLGVALRVAFFVSIGVGLSTPIWVYSGSMFSEIWTAGLFLGSAWMCLRALEGENANNNALALAGIPLGLAVLTRPVHVLGVLVFGVALLTRPGTRNERIKSMIAVGLPAFIGFLFYLGYNTVTHGRPFDFGYPEVFDSGTDVTSFGNNPLKGIFGFLLSPGKSVFLFAPLLVLAFSGWQKQWSDKRYLCVLSVVPLIVYVLFYSFYGQWEGGYCYGPRYLVPLIPMALLGIVPILKDLTNKSRNLIMALCLTGFLVQVPGVATSYIEDQAVPGGGTYYDSNLQYNLGHNPITSQWTMTFHYLGTETFGGWKNVPLGKGLDVWWMFLTKAGLNKDVIKFLLAIQAGLGIGGWILLNWNKESDENLPAV